MERLTEQQLQVLADLPYGKKYASARVAAAEELNRRSLAANTMIDPTISNVIFSQSRKESALGIVINESILRKTMLRSRRKSG